MSLRAGLNILCDLVLVDIIDVEVSEGILITVGDEEGGIVGVWI